MKYQTILASAVLAVSAVASANSTVLNVSRLPAQFRVSCSTEKAELVERKGKLFVVTYERDSNELTAFLTYAVEGTRAAQVRSANVETIKAGWFPKCAITLH